MITLSGYFMTPLDFIYAKAMKICIDSLLVLISCKSRSFLKCKKFKSLKNQTVKKNNQKRNFS